MLPQSRVTVTPIARSIGCALVATLAAFPRPCLEAQDQAPRQAVFRAGTMLVPVDVRVLDRQGQPVTNLRATDFTVLEDRQPQRVEHFWAQQLGATTPDGKPLGRRDAASTVGPPTRRLFLIVLGRGRLQPPARGVDGVIHLVRNRLLPQDHVAVLAWNRATDFTTDHAKVADLLERYKKAHERVETQLANQYSGLAAVYGSNRIQAQTQQQIDAVFDGPGVPVRTVEAGEAADAARLQRDIRDRTDALQSRAGPAGENLAERERLDVAGMTFDRYVETNAQSMQDLGQLYAGINYLRHLDGEKHLVYLSEFGIMLPRGEDDRSIVATANDARVVMNVIHTGGLPPAGVAPPWATSTARTVADLTGGYFTATSMATDAVDRIDRTSRFQYVLGYYTPRPLLNGRYRRIVVRVNRPDVTVHYRHGYFARADPPPLERRQILTQSRIAAAGSYQQDIRDIKVSGTATLLGGGQAPYSAKVDLRIDAARVSFRLVDGRQLASIDVSAFGGDVRQRLVGQTWQRMNLDVADAGRLQLLKDGITYTTTVPLRAVASFVKVIVYDYEADLLGSVKIPVRRD